MVGGSVTVFVAYNAEATDVIAIRHQGNTAGMIGVAGSQIRFGNVPIGTVTRGESGLLEISLDAAAAPSAVQALLRNLTFSSTTANPSPLPRTVFLTVSDGSIIGGTSAAVTKTVNVVSNSVIGSWDAVVIYAENAANTPVLLDTSVTLTDVDSLNFEGGTLKVSILQNATSDDRLGIRQ